MSVENVPQSLEDSSETALTLWSLDMTMLTPGQELETEAVTPPTENAAIFTCKTLGLDVLPAGLHQEHAQAIARAFVALYFDTKTGQRRNDRPETIAHGIGEYVQGTPDGLVAAKVGVSKSGFAMAKKAVYDRLEEVGPARLFDIANLAIVAVNQGVPEVKDIVLPSMQTAALAPSGEESTGYWDCVTAALARERGRVWLQRQDGEGFTESVLNDFLRQAARTPLLTKEQEVELAKRIEAGVLAQERLDLAGALKPKIRRELIWLAADGRAAKGHFITANILLVAAIAGGMRRNNMEYLDRIKEGIFGLIKAVEMFDHTRGNKFSTYASRWIWESIDRAIADQSRLIGLPIRKDAEVKAVVGRRQEMFEELHRDPTPEELAGELGMDPSEVKVLLLLDKLPLSLNTPPSDDERPLDELIADGHDSFSPHSVTPTPRTERLRSALGTLSDRNARIIDSLFGLTDGYPEAPERVAQTYGITIEWLKRIRHAAIVGLRAELGDGFLDNPEQPKVVPDELY